MRMITTVAEMRQWSDHERRRGTRIGFVPTMGALHAGHLSLITRAKTNADVVVASIFVNPTQFGPREDFASYPRTLERDVDLLAQEGVAVVFAPPTGEMYPSGCITAVRVEGLSARLEGAIRPSHFAGVTLVVAKLFHIVQPHVAVFGRKDAQQAIILQRMVRDLDFGVELDVAPTVREADGLAMSSRNVYLSIAERKQAVVLSRALQAGFRAWSEGERKSAVVRALMMNVLAEEPAARLDYLEIVSQKTLEPVAMVRSGTLVAGAIRVGKTRLIDNWWVREDGKAEF